MLKFGIMLAVVYGLGYLDGEYRAKRKAFRVGFLRGVNASNSLWMDAIRQSRPDVANVGATD